MLYKDFVQEKSHHLTRIKSAEGYPCVFDKSKGKALKDYKVYGNSTQNGTPSTTSPIEIQSVGDKSKNLLNVKEYFSDFLDADGNLVYNQSNFTSIYSKLLLTNKFKENTRYTLSCTVEISNADNNGIMFVFYDSNNTILNKSNGYATGSKTFKVKLTNDANTTIKYVRIGYGTSTRRCDVKISNLQIEEGATATNYIPYGKYVVPITVHGKNLIPYPYTTLDGVLVPTTKTESGVTFTINEDRSITINGTATNTIYYHLVSTYGTHVLILPRAKYYFRDNCDDINSTPRRFMVQAKTIDGSDTFLTTLGEGTLDTSPIQSCKIWLVITINQGDVFKNITFKPQLEFGSTATAYEPYREEITQTNIFLDAPLRKYNAYTDYIDFKRQKVIRQTGYKKITVDTLKSLTTSLQTYAVKPNALSWGGMSTIGSYRSQYGYNGAFHWYVNNTGVLFLFSPSEDITLGEYFTNLDIQTDVEFIWATSASTEEAITLPPILTLKDNNIITTTTTVTPSKIEVKYIAK